MESPMMNAAARVGEADEELEEPLTPSYDVASSSWLARVRAGKPYSAGWFALVFGLPITMAWGLLWLLLIALYALVSAQNNVPNGISYIASLFLKLLRSSERERDVADTWL